MLVKIDVLHSKVQAFLQPQPGPVQERHDNPHCSLHVVEDLAHFLEAEDHRDSMRHFGPRHLFDRLNRDAKHLLVQKQQGTKCLILC